MDSGTIFSSKDPTGHSHMQNPVLFEIRELDLKK